MKIVDRFMKIIDPLKWAKKHGMHVGEGVTLSSKNGTTFGSEPYLIFLDDYVRLSGGVSFITHDGGLHSIRDMDKYRDVVAFGAIHVGEKSFIGYKTIIMPGVKIGKRCIIGAGSIVTKDIPDYSIAVGVPAKVIGNTIDYADKMLLRTQTTYDTKMLKDDKRKYLESLAEIGII